MIALLSLALLLTLPNPTLTPGAIRPLTKDQICTIKWGKDRRHVTPKMKIQVAKNYGTTVDKVVAHGQGPCCEYDHRIPRELGGDDTVTNLWLQPWLEADVKDHLENQLHIAVCAGTLSLEEARRQILAWTPKR